jgi:hypothetical protein
MTRLAHFQTRLKDPLVIMKVMANPMPPEELIVSAESREPDSPCIEKDSSFPPSADSGTPWNVSTIAALLLLVIWWAVKLYTTWGAWGNLTIDSGHEMYVPAMLAEGKQLYRDLWFPFGPGAPYFTSYLFRLFGIRLSVLYWAGSLSAVGSAIFLYLTGMRLSNSFAGWAAGAVVLLEGFQPSMFSFPLPYSSAAAYGSFIGCLFLWFIVSTSLSGNRIWMFSAATAAAVAFLLKPEFGLAAYGCLALLIVIRAFLQTSWETFVKDVLTTLPGLAILGFVLRWMLSIAGADFLTQENIQSWPTSYFLKVYGKRWLEGTGFTVSRSAFLGAFHRGIPVVAVIFTLCVLLRWKRYDTRAFLIKALIVVSLFWYFFKHDYFVLSLERSLIFLASTVFFPRDMVLYIVVAAVAAWCYFWWKPAPARNLAFALVFSFSCLLAFRVLMRMKAGGYPIFYNGPAVLSFLLLLCMMIPRSTRQHRLVLIGEAVLCLACLAPVYISARDNEAAANDFVPLSTDRGTIRVSKHMAENYRAAIQFMKEQAALGQSVLSVPEDTSLYFLSGTYCPTRIYLFIPGAVAPGKMTEETIKEIEKKPVDYLLWSNRSFPEYGAPEFGKDYDPELGEYLKSHYRPVGPLIANDGKPSDWTAVVWQRIPEGLPAGNP